MNYIVILNLIAGLLHLSQLMYQPNLFNAACFMVAVTIWGYLGVRA